MDRPSRLSRVPELRHLRYFVVVAEELNFSRAATRLHMAQPPLSVAIRQLEEELGTDLFVRTTREVRLTDAGRVLLDGARRTLAEADRAVAAARRTGAGQEGQLRLAFSWSARFETLPALGRAFREEHPEIELLSQEMWNAQMSDALLDRTIDVAISVCPELASGVHSEVIRSERVVAVVAAANPAATEGTVSLSSLAGESFLLFPRELAPRLHDVLTETCRRAGFEPTVRTESFHTNWDLDLLADHALVALAPESVSTALPKGVTVLPLGDATEQVETRLLWRGEDPSSIVDAFRTVAGATFTPGRETARPTS
jgi:DNA-binding transcriptional LysR family regulator